MSAAIDASIARNDVHIFQRASWQSLAWGITDADGDPIDLSSGVVTFVAYKRGYSTAVISKATNTSTITITGTTNSTVTVTYSADDTALPGVYEYRIFHVVTDINTTRTRCIAWGSLTVLAAERGV